MAESDPGWGRLGQRAAFVVAEEGLCMKLDWRDLQTRGDESLRNMSRVQGTALINHANDEKFLRDTKRRLDNIYFL